MSQSFYYDYIYGFKTGDSLLVVKNGEIDNYPKCDENKNQKDSLKNISLMLIDSIEKNYFTVSSKHYVYDTITQEDRWKMRKNNKEEFNMLWKHYNYCTNLTKDTIIYIKKRAVLDNLQKIYYDSITSIIVYNCYTECDNYLKKTFWNPLFHAKDLKLIRLNLDDYKYKVVRKNK